MSLSPKYYDFSGGLYKIISELLKNQNLLRYIYYTGQKEHPLSDKLRDVSPKLIFDEYMEFSYIRDNLLDERQVVIFINPHRNTFRKRTLSVEQYIISIVVADEHRVIHTKNPDRPIEIRPYEIAREIANSIDYKRITGVGDVEITHDKADSLTRQFDILDIFIEVKKSNVKGFGNESNR